MPFEFDGWKIDVAVTRLAEGLHAARRARHRGLTSARGPMEAAKTGGLPRTYFGHPRHGEGIRRQPPYPYTPAVGLLNGLKLCLGKCCWKEGLETVFARHTRIATGVAARLPTMSTPGACSFARAPGALVRHGQRDPHAEGFDAARIVTHASTPLRGRVRPRASARSRRKVFPHRHLGSLLTDVMMLSGLRHGGNGLMADLGLDIRLGLRRRRRAGGLSQHSSDRRACG